MFKESLNASTHHPCSPRHCQLISRSSVSFPFNSSSFPAKSTALCEIKYKSNMPRTDEAEAFFFAVYSAIQEIPLGKVTSYGHIARLIGTRKWILYPHWNHLITYSSKKLESIVTYHFHPGKCSHAVTN